MMTTYELRQIYENRRDSVLLPLARKLETFIGDLVQEQQRIDRVTTRAKSIESFLTKANKEKDGAKKYTDPLIQIQDQVGARIVTYYLDDVARLGLFIEEYFGSIQKTYMVPDSLAEFGYEGEHLVLFFPDDLLTPDLPKEQCPEVFELQIKTLFQYAWAEANHDLAYKPVTELNFEQSRNVAYTAAQAWGADKMFNELAQQLLSNQS